MDRIIDQTDQQYDDDHEFVVNAIVSRMATSATIIKLLSFALFVVLLFLDRQPLIKALVGNVAFIVAWWAEARFLAYERDWREQSVITKYGSSAYKQDSTFWSWSVSTYYCVLIASLIVLLIAPIS